MKAQETIFEKVKGFKDYVISRDGRIVSLRTKKELKKSNHSGGYLVITLRNSKTKKYYTKYFHRVIATQFIPNPLKLTDINHIDGDKKNNSLDNLEWVTRKENVIHAHRIGKCPRTINHIRALKDRGKIVYHEEIGVFYESIEEASIYSGIKYSTLRCYLVGSIKKYSPYKYA